jgi:hypothetical protein
MEALLLQQHEHKTDDSTTQQTAAATPRVPQLSERYNVGETVPLTSATITAISDAQQRQQRTHRTGHLGKSVHWFTPRLFTIANVSRRDIVGVVQGKV